MTSTSIHLLPGMSVNIICGEKDVSLAPRSIPEEIDHGGVNTKRVTIKFSEGDPKVKFASVPFVYCALAGITHRHPKDDSRGFLKAESGFFQLAQTHIEYREKEFFEVTVSHMVFAYCDIRIRWFAMGM